MLLETLLQTKMMPPPQRPFLIPRPQLSQKLEQITSVPLTLVSAPAGFGKTTLVANWINEQETGSRAKGELRPSSFTRRPFSIAWVSLDQQDNESSRFWQYFIAAVSPSSSLAEQLAQPQPPPIQVLLTGLVNQLTQQPDHLLLVLDDIHLIENSNIYQNLTFLLDNAPPTLHLIFITRADPPLPLHRFRARGQLLEIRANDLRFNQTEAAAFLQQATPHTLADEDVALIIEQTEGWVVGLQLAALALPDHTAAQHQFIQRLASSNRYILEYLTEEVLTQQPEHVQTFLLQTAVLDELCADLCDAILEIGDWRLATDQPPIFNLQSQEILDYLDRHNLFTIPLDNAQQWYRYHHLFAALLQGHLRQQQPEQETILHRRAARWFAEHGPVETAVYHAFAAHDEILAAKLIEEKASHIVMQGRARLIESWLQRLPPEHLQVMPRANLAFAQALLLRGQLAETAHYIRQADAGNQASPDRPLQGQIQALHAVLADTRGDHQTAHALAQQAIQLAPSDDTASQAMAHFALAGAAREAGDVEAASALYDQTIPLCRAAHLLLLEILARAHLGFLCQLCGQLNRAKMATAPIAEANIQHPAAAAIYAVLASVYLERNQLVKARKWLQKALVMGQEGGHTAAAIQALILNGRFLLAKNLPEAAQQAFAEAAALFEQGAPAWQETVLRHAQVRFWLAQNDATMAAHCLAQATPPPPHMQDLLTLAQARIELHLGTPTSLAAARKILEDVVKTAASTGAAQAISRQRNGIVIEAELLLALVKVAQKKQQTALIHLQHALELAEPEGYVLVFIEMGASMQKLLVMSQNFYAKKLLAMFPQSPISGPSRITHHLSIPSRNAKPRSCS